MVDPYGLSASGIPDDLQAQMLGLKRQQAIAQALMQQGMAPMEMPQQGRMASKVSPLSAVAKALQMYMGHKAGQDADTKAVELGSAKQKAIADAMLKYEQTRSGTPEIPEPPPELGGGPGREAVPGNPRAAAMQAMANPMLAGSPMVKADFDSMQKAAEPYSLAPGAKRMAGDRVVAENVVPLKPEGPKKGQLRERVDGLNQIQEEFDGTKWNPIGEGPRFNPKVPTTNVTVEREKTEFKNEKTLRDEFIDASKPFVKVRDAYSTVQGSLAGDITAPATLAAATKFMKMLDPESVVRESELQMALKASGMMDRFLNLHNVVLKGNILTSTQAQEIQRIAGVLYQTADTQQSKVTDYYTKLAADYKLDPSRIVRDLSAEKIPKAAAVGVERRVMDGVAYVKRDGKWFKE